MIKIWLVTFSNGEEWHICGDFNEVTDAAIEYLLKSGSPMDISIKYLRWV